MTNTCYTVGLPPVEIVELYSPSKNTRLDHESSNGRDVIVPLTTKQGGMAEEGDVVPPWPTLFYDFTQDTTLHGLRYITLYSRYFIRRIIWAIVVAAAIALFIYINIQNMWTYYRYPTSVNVEVNYKSPLTFPVVTICNYNTHRLTAVSDIGLYDTMWRYYTPMNPDTEDYYPDTFEYYEGLCIYSEDEKAQFLNATASTHNLEYISQVACEKICALLYADECSGLFYNRSSKQCEITSAVISNDSFEAGACTEDSLEYYRRKHNLVPIDMTCSFESSEGCFMFARAVQLGTPYQDYWVTTEAEYHFPDTDSSIGSGRGHYIAMRRNSARVGLMARFQSARMLLNDSCLSLYYSMSGWSTEIKVYTIDEQLTVNDFNHRCSVSDSLIGSTWTRMFCPLPYGIHQVIIDGLRGDSMDTTSIALDDVTIWPRSRYFVECKRTRSGIDYLGNESRTMNGRQCKFWPDVWLYHMHMPIEFSNTSCRNPGGLFEQPFCYIETYPYVGYCNVPNCGCEPNYLGCLDGHCLPSDLFCDGINDCGDFSDENERHCAHHQSLACDFEDRFLCGYRSTGALGWSQVIGGSVGEGEGPSHDATGSVTRKFMYISPRLGVAGDMFRLESPVFTASTSDCLQFYFFLSGSHSGLGDFTVYTEDVVTGSRFYTYGFATDTAGWMNSARLQLLQSGPARLVFEHVKGSSTSFTVGLDNVRIFPCPDNDLAIQRVSNPAPEIVGNQGFSCDFNSGDRCGYLGDSNQHYAVWGLTSAVHAMYPLFEYQARPTPCSGVYVEGEGLIQHPGYPQEYANNMDICVAHIIAPPGTSISLEALLFDVEDSIDCQYDVVEIYNGGYLPEHIRYRLCGNTLADEPPLVLGNDVFIWLKTDSSAAFTGFQFKYQLQPYPYDNGMVLQYTGPSSDTMYSATLSSEWDDAVGELCLSYSMSLDSNTAFSAILMNSMLPTETVLLYLPPLPSRVPWYRVHHNVSAVHGTQYRLKFRINFSGRHQGKLAIIDDIALAQSPCVGTYQLATPETVSSNISCNFATSGPTICDFIDSSPINPGWILREISINEDTPPRAALVARLSRKLDQTLAISFPIFNTSESLHACVEMQWSVASGEDVRITADLKSPSLNRTLSTSMLLADFCIIPYPSPGQVGTKVSSDQITPFRTFFVFPSDLKHISLRVKVQGHFIERMALHHVVSHPSDYCSLLILDDSTPVLNFEAQYDLSWCCDECINMGEPSSDEIFSFQDMFITQIIPQDTNTPVREVGAAPVAVPAIEKSVRTFYMSTAHRIEDFVYKCTYNGEPCLNDSLATSVTDYGVCLTFNSGEMTTALTSQKPGSRYGLQMVLNVEQYEHMTGSNTDAGVKVQLHDQRDQSNIRDQGIAAPLASHSLVAAKYIQTISLGPPYGSCGNESLHLYPNESYSFSRCLQGCDTYSLLEDCGCKHFYMRGNSPYCSVRQLLECTIPNWESSTDKCHCPDSCDKVSFEFETSSTSFSSLGIRGFLNDNMSLINDRLLESVAVRKRFDPDELYSLLSKVNVAMTSIEKFLLTTEFTVVAGQNSPYYLIEKSIWAMADITTSDIDLILRNLQQYMDDFNRAIGYKQEALLSKVNEAAHELELFIELLTMSPDTDLDIIMSASRNLEKKLRMVQRYLDISFSSLRPTNNEPYTLPEYPILSFPTDSCGQSDDNMRDIQDGLPDVFDNLHQLSNATSSEMLQNDMFNSANEQLLGHLHELSLAFPLCYGEYKRQLGNLINWHRGLNLENLSDTVMDGSFILDIAMVKDSLTALKDAYTSFLTNDFDFQGFAAQFTSINEKILAMINNIKSRVENELDNPLRLLIAQTENRLVDAYMIPIDGLTGLQEYMGTTVDFSMIISPMGIWRMPMSSINDEDIITFSNSAAEVISSWPSSSAFRSYMSHEGRAYIEDVMARFMEEMIRHLDENINGLSEDISHTQQALDHIKTIVGAYNDSVTIDQNFLTNNFLALDVYYGELRYVMVEQLPLYQLDSFFSDMGGYMGLLLGASAMTVVELLDLLIYNCARKCGKGHKQNKSAKGADGVDSSGARDAVYV